MGFDKTKAIRAAEKYLAQGKIPAAIKEYRQVLEHDAGDFTALNMLGDLYARVDKKQEAVECFSRVAEHYRGQGFALKAIAMYKKLSRINPGDPEVANKLAALYEQQGLLSEARSQYLIVADAYTRAGKVREALGTMRRIANLEPHNADIRLRLAESYLHEGVPDEAAEAFLEAGARLSAQGHHGRALEAYTKVLEFRPYDRTALSGIVRSHSALGAADEAVEVLEKAVAEQPEDVELLTMLARAYIEAGNAPAAERVSLELASREPSSYAHFFDVARLYLQQGDAGGAARVLTQAAGFTLARLDEDILIELLHEVLTYNPEQLDVLRLLVRIYTYRRDDNRTRAALDRLAAAAESAGLEDEERHTLEKLVWLAPDEPRYAERLRALGGSAESLPAAQEDKTEPSAPAEVPTFESFMLTDDQLAPTTNQAANPPNEAALEFEWNSVAAPDEHASFADFNDAFAETNASPASTETSQTLDHSSVSFQELDFNTPLEAQPPLNKSATSSAPLDERLAALLRQELESVDFYLAQGYMDIARSTLDMLEEQYGAQPDIEARRQALEAGSAPTPVSESAPPLAMPTAEFTDFTRYDVAAEEPSAETQTAKVDNVFVERTGATSSSNHPQSSAGAPTQPGIDPGLAAIFDEFREAVEEEEVATGADYETHYNLGLAYKEMDLLDEAIEEFQSATGLVAPQDGTPRYLQCCNLLGHCFIQKGMPSAAAMWFKKGLDAPGHTEDEYQALRYELGIAYEQIGDLDRAIEVFTEVYGINVSYRGVSEKLRALQEQRAAK